MLLHVYKYYFNKKCMHLFRQHEMNGDVGGEEKREMR